MAMTFVLTWPLGHWCVYALALATAWALPRFAGIPKTDIRVDVPGRTAGIAGLLCAGSVLLLGRPVAWLAIALWVSWIVLRIATSPDGTDDPNARPTWLTRGAAGHSRLRRSLRGLVFVIALGVRAPLAAVATGVTLIAVAQTCLCTLGRLRPAALENQRVRQVENLLFGARTSLESATDIGLVELVAILALLLFVAAISPRLRLVSRLGSLRRAVSLVLTSLTVITSFSFFSEVRVHDLDRDYRALLQTEAQANRSLVAHKRAELVAWEWIARDWQDPPPAFRANPCAFVGCDPTPRLDKARVQTTAHAIAQTMPKPHRPAGLGTSDRSSSDASSSLGDVRALREEGPRLQTWLAQVRQAVVQSMAQAMGTVLPVDAPVVAEVFCDALVSAVAGQIEGAHVATAPVQRRDDALALVAAQPRWELSEPTKPIVQPPPPITKGGDNIDGIVGGGVPPQPDKPRGHRHPHGGDDVTPDTDRILLEQQQQLLMQQTMMQQMMVQPMMLHF